MINDLRPLWSVKMSGKPTKFVDEPQALLCPMCGKVFSEPVISIKCGHTFCRSCIQAMIRDGARCPVDAQGCDSDQLVLNKAVMGQIDDLKIYCCNGLVSKNDDRTWETDPEGCKEVVILGRREEHEAKCQFANVECPIGGDQCGVIRLNQMDRHMSTCARVPCPFSNFGCAYHGTSVDVTQHKSSCIYKDESQLLIITMRELKLVKQSNEELQSSNRELQQSLTKALKSIDRLVIERSTQLEQQALTITAITSRMDSLEESVCNLSLRSDKIEDSLRSWTPHGSRGYTMGTNSVGTPIIREKSSREKRWSVESVTSLASAHDNSLFHSNHYKPFVWQMPFTVKCIGTFKGHKGTIWSLLAHANWLFSSSSDGTIKVWDIADLRKGCVRTVTTHKDCSLMLATSRGVLYSSGTDLALRSWYIDTMEEVGAVQKAHDSMISAIVCSKQYLFTSSLGCIKVWDLISLKEIHSIDNISQSWIRALAYEKRADYLYSTTNNRLHIWKASDNFNLVKEIDTHFGAIYSLALSKRLLVTGTHSQNIQVYDRSTLKHHCTLNGHIGIVTNLRVTESPHGVYMFSASSDTTVQVWNLENMLPILALQRHEKPIQALAISQDSVFTGSEDMEIKVFRHFKL